jgi:hypothetical protein
MIGSPNPGSYLGFNNGAHLPAILLSSKDVSGKGSSTLHAIFLKFRTDFGCSRATVC